MKAKNQTNKQTDRQPKSQRKRGENTSKYKVVYQFRRFGGVFVCVFVCLIRLVF